MARFFAGVVAALLLVAAGFFIWQSQAKKEQLVPAAPEAASLPTPFRPARAGDPPAATEKTREEKRFARADKDKDGRIAREELLSPRRKAFAKLDANSDGRLAFEEWAVKTIEKFSGADADKDGALSAPEFSTTAPPRRPRRQPNCAC